MYSPASPYVLLLSVLFVAAGKVVNQTLSAAHVYVQVRQCTESLKGGGGVRQCRRGTIR